MVASKCFPWYNIGKIFYCGGIKMRKMYDIEAMTIEDFTQLIADGDDRHHNQIRVSKSGKVYLSQDIVGAEKLEGVAFRLESFDAGNDYVGKDASEDKEYVLDMYQAIKENWKAGCPMTYLDTWNIG